MLDECKAANSSVEKFLGNQEIIKDVFAHSDKVPKTVMYGKYVGWCKQKELFAKTKKDFYDEVLSNPEYVEIKINGYDNFRNTSIKSDGAKEKLETF